MTLQCGLHTGKHDAIKQKLHPNITANRQTIGGSYMKTLGVEIWGGYDFESVVANISQDF